MLIALLFAFLLVFAAVRAACLLARLWRGVPRSNADFGLF